MAGKGPVSPLATSSTAPHHCRRPRGPSPAESRKGVNPRVREWRCLLRRRSRVPACSEYGRVSACPVPHVPPAWNIPSARNTRRQRPRRQRRASVCLAASMRRRGTPGERSRHHVTRCRATRTWPRESRLTLLGFRCRTRIGTCYISPANRVRGRRIISPAANSVGC